LADDSAGTVLAATLRQRGMPDVWLESEIEDEDGMAETAQDRPLILLDAVNLEETPGKVILLPMNIVLQNSTLSHRMLPIVTEILTPEQMRNAWLLGIQVKSLDGRRPISPPVRAAMETVLEQLSNDHSEQA